MESERDMYRQFQDWCLRTYGDSGKTKTVTRKKYERIVQLLNGCESSSTDNAKFKFWVKSKGFQLGQPDEVRGGGGGAKQVLYVPVKTTVGAPVSKQGGLVLRAPQRGLVLLLQALTFGARGDERQREKDLGLPPPPPGPAVAKATVQLEMDARGRLERGSPSRSVRGWRTSPEGDGIGVDEKLSLRRVAVVEDFFDIIYSMHVETGPNGEQIRKHAGQKRTYKAISESYAFLPREAVTRFLMSCSECQKRMHLNPDGTDHKDNGKPPTLVTSMIDYNMPITMAYMKHMKLQLLNSQQDEVKRKYLRLYHLHVGMQFDSRDCRVKRDGIWKTVIYFFNDRNVTRIA
ncbi:hypothetical protein CB1_000954001 [Camelus ferus]|nr:hypothetical protein CB1_000954001 [Camelus ferus]